MALAAGARMLTSHSSRVATVAMALAFTLVTTHALATEETAEPNPSGDDTTPRPTLPPHDEETAVTPHPALRIGGALTGGYAYMHRSLSRPSNKDGLVFGGEVHVHPYSAHGFFGGVTGAEGIFGPSVTIIDAGYSLQFLGSPSLKGFTGAGYLDVGPAFAFVSHADPAPDHDVLGGHASVAFDAQIYNVTLGVAFGYRGGVPLSGANDAWEGALTSVLRLGAVFDLGVEKPKEDRY